MFQINHKFRILVSTVIIVPMIFSLVVPAGILFADENGTVVEQISTTVDASTETGETVADEVITDPKLDSETLGNDENLNDEGVDENVTENSMIMRASFSTVSDLSCTNKSVTATVDGSSAELIVPDGACPVKVSFSSYSHEGTIRPFEAQVLTDNITDTYGPGTYNLNLGNLSCNWQTDIYYGDVQENLNPDYGHSGLIAYDYAENQNCTIPEPKICTPFAIENFDVDKMLVSNDSVSFSSPNSLGDELDISHSELVSQTNLSRVIITGNKIYANYDSSSYGITTLVWDGVDNNASDVNKNGLNNFDLTEGGIKDSFGFTYSSDFVDNKDVKIVMTVYSGNNSSSITTSLYNVAGTWHEGKINFSDFTITSGTGADFTKVGAIEMKIDTTSRYGHDFGIGNIRTLCKGNVVINTPPTITLVGANPFNMTVNTAFTDPGATAADLEDGNLTSEIVVTGNVATTTVGTYTLTYTVTDSGGLSTSTTRSVIVSPVSDPKLPSVIIGADPQTITEGASSTLAWSSQNTTSCGAVWTNATTVSGTMSVAPTVTTDYGIKCTGPKGDVTATTTVTVVPKVVPPVNPPTDNGGGGGGGIGGRRHPVVVGEILGATSCLYLIDYLKIDWENDPIEVLKLQSFLNVFEKESLSYTGVYDQATFDAVVRFQNKYASDILNPWGENVTTGFVYILTKKKVNEIYCNTVYPLSLVDQNEIDSFRTSGGASSVTGNTGFNTGAGVIINDRNLGTLLGDSVDSIADNISDVLNGSAVVELKDSGKSALRNAAISLFSLPQRMFDKLFQGCGYTPTLLFLILIALAVIIIKLFANSVKGNEPKGPIMGTPNTGTTANVVKDSPVIILPGVMPDEEIIIENPEEGSEEVLINTPDLRPDQDKKS